MKPIRLLLFTVMIFGTGLLYGVDVSGTINGQTWTAAESPYRVIGNINIQDLTIEPGVTVAFDGNYEFKVTGLLMAVGTRYDSIFFQNYPSFSGNWRGIVIEESSTVDTLKFVQVTDASPAGIKIRNNTTHIEHCQITGNNGNGISVSKGLLQIYRTEIRNNTQNGLEIDSSGFSMLRAVRITANGNKGINLFNGKSVLENVIISYNNQGGIILNTIQDSLEFTNTVIADHGSEFGIFAFNGNIVGRNSIIYFNDTSVGNVAATIDLTYSDVNPAISGTENISADPLFLDRNNYALLSGSICIDKGLNELVYNDICFPPSLGGVRNDIGAYGGPGACEWYDQLFVWPESIDFGPVTINIPSDTSLNIKNYRNRPLEISDINITGSDSGFFSADVVSFIVSAFDSQTVTVNFLPTERRTYSATLEIFYTDDQIIIPLTGSGEIPNIDVLPTDLPFNSVAIGDSLTREINISNLAVGDLIISGLNFSNNDFFAINDLKDPIPFGKTEKLFVIFKPDTIGPISGTLAIINNDPDENPVNVTLSGTGKAGVISASQDTIKLGDVSAGSFADTNIVIENSGNDTLQIFSRTLESDSPYFSIEDTSTQRFLPPGSEPDIIKVRFHPQVGGDYLASLIICSSDPFKDSLSVSITGHSIKPIATSIPEDSIKFDEVMAKTVSRCDVKLKNTGNANLEIFPVILDQQIPDDSSFSVFNFPTDTIISPQDSLTFEVAFSPNTENEDYTAVLKIPTNDIDKDTLSLFLSGKSVLPVLAGSETIDFGEVVLREDSIKAFKLWNAGTGTLIIDSLYTGGTDPEAFTLFDHPLPDSLTYSDTLKTEIKFTPHVQGELEAYIFIRTNLPEPAKLDSFLVTGTGLKPVIGLSADSVLFNLTYIGDPSVKDTVYVSNTGNGKLDIDSLYFAAGGDTRDFIINLLRSPYLAGPGAVDTIIIEFNPEAIDKSQRQATLLVQSNDPDSPEKELTLKGSAKSPVVIRLADSLGFESTFVDLSVKKFITIANDGDRDLHVFTVTFDNPADSIFFAGDMGTGLIVNPGSMDSLSITFKPDEEGPANSTAHIISNDPIHDTVAVALSGMGKTDPSPANITVTDFPDSLVSGEDYTIRITISENQAPLSWCHLLARPGARSVFDTLSMTQVVGSDSIWETALTGDLITERGLEYYFEVRHGGRNSLLPEFGDENPQYAQVHIRLLRYPAPTRINEYQMISLPVESANRTMASLFGDTLGTYDDSQYRVFDYDSGYIELKEMNEPLPRGKAFWLITRTSKELAVRDVKSPEVLSLFSILLKKGWNMISLPFPFPVSPGLLDVGMISGGVFYNWNGNGWDTNITTLMPYDGYAVYALADTVIQVPPTAAVAGLSKEKTVIYADWQIGINAVRGQYQDMNNFAGVHQNALDGFDHFDLPEPPSPGSFVSVYFYNPETPLMADFRAPADTAHGYRFDFAVVSNFTGTTVLSFYDENLPAGYRYTIVSDETGVRYDDPQAIEISANRQDLVLYVGATPYIEKVTASYQSMPIAYTISQNYPNPFNPATNIKYALPVAGKVDLIVYDILGKVIRNLKSGSFQEAGYHSVSWDGTNNRYQPVSSGIYFLTLRTSGYHHSIKMLLQR